MNHFLLIVFLRQAMQRDCYFWYELVAERVAILLLKGVAHKVLFSGCGK